MTHSSWWEMMEEILKKDKKPRGGWSFDNFYFITSDERKSSHLPNTLTMLTSYYRNCSYIITSSNKLYTAQTNFL